MSKLMGFVFLASKTVSDKYIALSFILFGVVVLFLAITAVSHDPREQTVFLERFAEQLVKCQNIHPATEETVQGLIASFRQKLPADNKLQQRQFVAISRVEARLSDPTGALRQNNPARYSRTIPPL